ncbi:MAG: hypothetical protein WA687_02480 [Solirubrobacterales bacterium]
MEEPTPSRWSHLILPLRAVSIVSVVFGFTCLGVLVVVTAVDDNDALSTVALALAILAFSVQLIVFIAQQNLASEQGRRNEELYGSMQTVLAEIREKAEGTQADVRTINEKLLSALISKNASDGGGLAHVLPQLLDPANASPHEGQSDALSWVSRLPERRPVLEDERYVQTLESFPSQEEAPELMQQLTALSPNDQDQLKRFGDDEIIARRPGSPFDPWLFAPGNLLEHGFVEPYPPERQPDQGPKVFRLTDRGRNVARLLTANGDPPPYLADLTTIRQRMPERADWMASRRQGAGD